MPPRYRLAPTAFGPVALAFSANGLAAVELPSDVHEPEALVASRIEARGAVPVEGDHAAQRELARRVGAYLAGADDDFADVALDLPPATELHRKAYATLRAVKRGEALSYGELAARVGAPGAVRAIGQAMARNPVPLVVPCHRVLDGRGKLGGYSAAGGAPLKARLLVLEGARSPESIVTAADPALGRMIAAVGPFAMERRPADSIFVSLARAVVFQQLAGKAAETIWGRVKALFPEALTPEAVRAMPLERLRAAGLSAAKAASVKDLAEKAIAGVVAEEAALAAMPDAEVIARLTAVRGIGPWSVEMLLMFRLGRMDVLPATDFGVRKGFQLLHRLAEMPAPKELMAYGERWRPYRSVASWYLWRALERLRDG